MAYCGFCSDYTIMKGDLMDKKVEKKASLFKMVSFTVCGIVVLDSFVAPVAMGVSSIRFGNNNKTIQTKGGKK